MTSIEQVIQVYPIQGFKVHTILEDGRFSHIHKLIKEKSINMNICAADKHVPEIVMKGVRSIVTVLPFERYPP